MSSPVTAQELLQDLKRVAKEIGHSPSGSEYRKNGGRYSVKPFITHFLKWGNAIKEIGGEIQRGGKKRIERPDIPLEIYNQFFKIEADKVIIFADAHIPYHDVSFFNKVLDTAEKLKIRTCVIAGDFWDFRNLYKKDVQTKGMGWIDELQTVVTDVMNVLLETFDNIYILEGNHEFRLVRFLESRDDAQKLYSLIFNNPKIHISKYQYCTINSWLVVQHKANTKVKLSKLEKVVNVNRKSMIVFHSHRFVFGAHDSGIEIMGEGLCVTRPDAHEYASMDLNDNSKWLQGFWLVLYDKIYPYVNHNRIGNILDFQNETICKK